MLELLQRKQQLVVSDLDTVRRRIVENENRQHGFQTNSRGGGQEKEMEKLHVAIVSDRAFLDFHTKRNEHMRWALWQELQWLHQNKMMTSKLYSQFVTREVQSAERMLDTWSRLSTHVEDLPMVFS